MRSTTTRLADAGYGSSAGTAIRAQTTTGASLYHLVGVTLRDTSSLGERVHFFDRARLRHRDATGASIYHLDATIVRAVNASEARPLFWDRRTWRAFGPSGAALFHFDGIHLRYRDKGGAIIAFFGQASPDLAALAILKVQGLVPS